MAAAWAVKQVVLLTASETISRHDLRTLEKLLACAPRPRTDAKNPGGNLSALGSNPAGGVTQNAGASHQRGAPPAQSLQGPSSQQHQLQGVGGAAAAAPAWFNLSGHTPFGGGVSSSGGVGVGAQGWGGVLPPVRPLSTGAMGQYGGTARYSGTAQGGTSGGTMWGGAVQRAGSSSPGPHQQAYGAYGGGGGQSPVTNTSGGPAPLPKGFVMPPHIAAAANSPAAAAAAAAAVAAAATAAYSPLPNATSYQQQSQAQQAQAQQQLQAAQQAQQLQQALALQQQPRLFLNPNAAPFGR